MLRQSTHSILKQAAKLSSRPSSCSMTTRTSRAALLSTRASSSAAGNSPSPSDYDRIMRTTVSSFSTSAAEAGDNDTSSSYYSRFSSIMTPRASSATAAATTVQSNATAQSNCYRSVDFVEEPTVGEDYDRYELHHPPCERTTQQMEYYYNDDASFDPTGAGAGEMGSIV